MKKIRNFICLVIALVFCTLSVAGCALFERDVEYYNNLVVATIGNDIKITKKELISGFNNFGYRYVTEQGMTQKDAMEETLNMLIDREIMVELSLQRYTKFYTKGDIESLSDAERDALEITGDDRTRLVMELRKKQGEEGLFYQALSKNERDEVRKNAFEQMDKNLKTFADRVREERKRADKIAEEEGASVVGTSEAKKHDVFRSFVPQIFRSVNNTVFTLDISAYVTVEDFSYVADVWTPQVRDDEDASEKAIADEAYARFVRTLKNNEKGLNFSKNEDKDIVQREIDRNIDAYSKNMLLERFRDCFMQGITEPINRMSDDFKELVAQFGNEELAYRHAVNEANNGQAGRVELAVAQAVDYYKGQVKTQIDRYKKGLDTNESLGSKIIESLEGVYWLPKAMIEEDFFTVSHILISYNDAQTAEFAKMKEDLRVGNITAKTYGDLLAKLENEVSGVMRNEKGEEVGAAKTANVILNEINNAMVSLSESNAQERIKTFRDFIYKYNTDPGMVNPEFEYVMGVNDSKMVEPFTDASRELFGYEKMQVFSSNGQPMLDENGKQVFEWKKKNGFTPTRSDMSGLVMTDYGAHIIMYTRPLKDFINVSMEGSDHNYQDYLFGAQTSYGDFYLNQDSGAKTYFDAIVDKLNKPAFENNEKISVITFKQQKENGKLVNPVKKYRGNYKDLF